MITDIKAKVAQLTPVITGEGDMDYPKMTKLGALFTADWKQQLLLAGYLWQARVGTIASGADPTFKLGGGSGLTIDADQPELVIGVDAGYYLIPVDARVSVYSNCDSDADMVTIALFADRTQAPLSATAMASAVLHEPINMFDGLGGSFPGRCWVECTADITDPVTSQILDIVAFAQTTDASATGSSPIVKMDYNPSVPTILAGPCQVVLCWGGTSGTYGIGVVTVGVVPSSHYPTS